jgi:hypothetical protein
MASEAPRYLVGSAFALCSHLQNQGQKLYEQQQLLLLRAAPAVNHRFWRAPVMVSFVSGRVEWSGATAVQQRSNVTV